MLTVQALMRAVDGVQGPLALLTLAVIARIHWQAVRLWVKRTPFFRQPAPPADFVTAGSPQP